MSHHAPPAFAVAVIVAAMAAFVDTPSAHQGQVVRELPHVRELGRALTEFNDGVVHAVAAYYYSQRHHDTPWLLVEVGLNSQKTVRVHRESIEIQTPSGVVVPLASHRQWSGDVERASQLYQAASPTRHQVRTYFLEFATFTPLRFVRPPSGSGTIVDFADLTLDQVFLGDLVFRAPTNAWERGRHVLTIHNAASTVRVPIDLR